MRRAIVGTAFFAVGMLVAARARAQEIQLRGPLVSGEPQTIFTLTHESVAARHEMTFWLALGGSPAPEEAAAGFAGAGAQLTNVVVRTSGLLGVPSEIRWGPWGEMWIDGAGGRVEGGLLAQLYLYGRGVHAPVDLRAGGGFGDDLLGRTPHLTLTISGGPRYIEAPPPFLDRRDLPDGDLPRPQLLAGWALFLSARRTLESSPQVWVTGGVELSLGFVNR